MSKTPTRCDIFCKVIDNYGDAGVSWRLAKQLAGEHGWKVRLWIDDANPLRQLAPDHDSGPVEVRPWPRTWLAAECAEVVIEAFACELPAAYVEAMAERPRPPVWLNLEYLSAESWVTGCHGLPSPHPHLPLLKHFFFPGFVTGTGGLLREREYEEKGKRFDPAAFRAEFGLPPQAAGELSVSLFAYPGNPALPGLLSAWAASPSPICVLQPGNAEPAQTIGKLRLHPLPFLPQSRYDELLWACDLNFVRGEDSFVRAQWAAKPFVWQIYPQAEDAHMVKLDAFLALHPAGEQLHSFWHAWNGDGTTDWRDFAARIPDMGKPLREWSETLAAGPNLAAELVYFCLERLK